MFSRGLSSNSCQHMQGPRFNPQHLKINKVRLSKHLPKIRGPYYARPFTSQWVPYTYEIIIIISDVVAETQKYTHKKKSIPITTQPIRQKSPSLQKLIFQRKEDKKLATVGHPLDSKENETLCFCWTKWAILDNIWKQETRGPCMRSYLLYWAQ